MAALASCHEARLIALKDTPGTPDVSQQPKQRLWLHSAQPLPQFAKPLRLTGRDSA